MQPQSIALCLPPAEPPVDVSVPDPGQPGPGTQPPTADAAEATSNRDANKSTTVSASQMLQHFREKLKGGTAGAAAGSDTKVDTPNGKHRSKSKSSPVKSTPV